MKTCPTCHVKKQETEFWKGQCYCIPCHKEKQKTEWKSRTPAKRLEQHLKYKYGITSAKFLKVWNEQKGACAICLDALPALMSYENRRRGYAIDHNHETGQFRGILCVNCNTLLGMAKDSKKVLSNAISYLENKGSYEFYLGDNMRAARKK